MDEKLVSDDQFTHEGQELVHSPSGVRIWLGDEGMPEGIPINHDHEMEPGWRLDAILRKAEEMCRRRSSGVDPCDDEY